MQIWCLTLRCSHVYAKDPTFLAQTMTEVTEVALFWVPLRRLRT